MPIYEYKCQKCGEKFEVQLSIRDASSKQVCPKCHSEDTRRIYSAAYGSSGSSCSTSPGRPRHFG